MRPIHLELPARCAECAEGPTLRHLLVTRALAGQIIRAQEEERARLARELHDDTGQALTLILVRLATIRQLVGNDALRSEMDGLHELVSDTLEGVRRLASDLGPTVLRDLGLAAALELLVARLREETKLTIDLTVHLASAGLTEAPTLALYRVAQEALTNVVRHARATSVAIRLDRVGSGVRLVIEDDGVGFVLPAELDSDSVGLYGMRERLGLVGGTLDLSTRPGHGTRISAIVPGVAE